MGDKALYSYDSLSEQIKKPAGINEGINEGALHTIFREMQETDIINPPTVDISILFNPNPITDRRLELADKFNTISFEQHFYEWTETLLRDERFQSYKDRFENTEYNYKDIGVQKAEDEIINIIKEALSKKGNTNLRFDNMFGTEFFDPDFILLGIPSGINAKVRGNTLIQDKFKTSMSTLDKVNELKDVFDIYMDLDLFVLKGKDMYKIPVDGTTNLADWLQDNDFSVDDKIIALPNYEPPMDQPLFENINWKTASEGGEYPSPYLPIFESFLTELTSELNRMGIFDTNNYDVISNAILKDIPEILRSNGYSLSDILLDLKDGNEFLNFDERTLDRWYVIIKNKILNKANPSATKGEFKDIQAIFEDLHRKIGSSKLGKYYRQAKLVSEEIIMIFLEEGIFDHNPTINEIIDYLDFSLYSFVYPLGIRDYPHKPEVIIKLKESISEALSHDNRYDSYDVNRIMNKVETAISPYVEIIEDYWHAEGVWSNEEGIFYRVKLGPRKKLISNIFHSHKILEQINVKAKLSSLLFASPDYLTSHFLDKGEIDKRPKPDRLERMSFLVSRWDSSLFGSLGIEVTQYQVEIMKRLVLAEIQKWMFVNPRASYKPKSRLKWEPYVKEHFVKWGRVYTKEELKPHYNLVNSIMTAAAARAYKDYSWSSKQTLDFSTGPIQRELGLYQGFYASLRTGSFYTQKTLERIFSRVAEWHRNEFGDRVSGLDYDRSDSYARYKLYLYQDVLYKVKEYAKLRGITLFDGKYSTGLVTINNQQYKISDILKKDYDNNFIKTAYKEFHLLFQLAKYLGFDPLTFTPLEDADMATGRYALHHFLAEMFRKMSSNVADIVLTSQELHNTYESILRAKGEEGEIYAQAREAEAFIRALMKSIQDLIGYKDGSKYVSIIKESHIKEVLIKNLGIDKGTEVFYQWTENKYFKDNLKMFNIRRPYAHKGDYQNLLTKFYKETWNNRAQNAYLFISKQLKYSIFFSYRTDFDLLYKIFPQFKKQITF